MAIVSKAGCGDWKVDGKVYHVSGNLVWCMYGRGHRKVMRLLKAGGKIETKVLRAIRDYMTLTV